MSRVDEINTILDNLGAGASYDQVEYALRDYEQREVVEVLADRSLSGGVGSITEITSDDASVTITDPTGPVVDLSAGGGAALLTATVTLTHAQILTLPTTPVTVLAAPAANEAVLVLGGLMVFNQEAGGYTNVAGSGYIGLLQTTAGLEASCFATWAQGFGSAGTFMPLTSPIVENDAGYIPSSYQQDIGDGLSVFANNAALGNYTGGHASNTLKIVVNYLLVDV